MNTAKKETQAISRDEVLFYEQLALKRLKEIEAPPPHRRAWLRNALSGLAWAFKKPEVQFENGTPAERVERLRGMDRFFL